MSVEVALHARTVRQSQWIVAGLFNKFLTKRYGVCRILYATHITVDTMFGSRFSVLGVAVTGRQAHLSTLYTIAHRANARGVVVDAIRHWAWRHILGDPTVFAMRWEHLLLDPMMRNICIIVAPAFFIMLKWKPQNLRANTGVEMPRCDLIPSQLCCALGKMDPTHVTANHFFCCLYPPRI